MKKNTLPIILICQIIFIGCGASKKLPVSSEPGWINYKNLNREVYHYGVGGPAPTMQEAKENARIELAKSVGEIQIEAEFTRFVKETDEKISREIVDKSRSYVKKRLADVVIDKTYSHSEGFYALVRLSKRQFKEWIQAPIREIQIEVNNRIEHGETALRDGRVMDALKEFAFAYRTAQTLPRKYDWIDEQKSERYTSHLKRRLDKLTNDISLQIVSGNDQTKEEIASSDAKTLIFQAMLGTKPIKQLPVKVRYKIGNGKIRTLDGRFGEMVEFETDSEGRGKITVELGSTAAQQQISVEVDVSQLSLLGQGNLRRLKEKSITFVCNISSKMPSSGDVIAVMPFHNLDNEAKFDRLSRVIQSSFTTVLANVRTFKVRSDIDLSDILKKLELEMTDLIEQDSAARVGKFLGVTHIVGGNYTVIGKTMKLDARLVKVETAEVIAGISKNESVLDQNYEPTDRFFNLTGELAWTFAQKIEPSIRKEIVLSQPVEAQNTPIDSQIYELFDQAKECQESGRTSQAIDLYSNILELNPNSAETHNNLGNAYLDDGQIGMAQLEYDKAIRLKPNYSIAHNNFGWLLLQVEDFDRAIREFRKALKYDAENVKFKINLAWAYHLKGDYETAIEKNLELLIEDAGNLLARYNLALAYLCDGNFPQAEVEYRSALKMTPDHDDLAYQSAMDDLKKMLEKREDPKEVHKMLRLMEDFW